MRNKLPENIHKAIDQIQMDNTSGSVELARKSAEIFALLMLKTDSLAQVKNVAYSLIKAQPTMASIFNLVNNLMINIEANKDQELKHIIQSYCKKFLQDLNESDRLISENTSELIENNSTVITHSYSSTILNTLIFAKKSGKKFSVICTESRPMKEGVKLAKILGENGVKVKLIVDSAVFLFLDDADIILFGGDAITTKGLVNKIGTKGITITATNHNTPIFALCSTLKFLPENYPLRLDQQKNPEEIIRDKLPNITPVNYYFDLTPLEYLTGVITEKGIIKPPDIKSKLSHLPIYKDLSRNPIVNQ